MNSKMQPRADSNIHIEFERCRDVEQNLMIVIFRSNTWLYVGINVCSILGIIFVMINIWNKEKITALSARSLLENSPVFECLFRKRVLGVWAWNRQNITLQHTGTYCNILQHRAAHCNALQHTTPRAIWARSQLQTMFKLKQVEHDLVQRRGRWQISSVSVVLSKFFFNS